MRTPGSISRRFQARAGGRRIHDGRAQTPWEELSLTGDFFFVLSPRRRQSRPPHDVDLAFWDSIKDSTNPANFEAYLQQFPDGAFTRLARVRLAELSGADRSTVRAGRGRA